MENADESANIAAATEEQAEKSDEQKSSIAVTEAEDEDITESQFGEIDESQMSEEIEEEGLASGMSEIGDKKAEPVYGGCEGPDAMYVKLISSDGHEFMVKREHALISGTIKTMLSGPKQFAENETNEIHFKNIPSHVLQKVCMYFTYKARYTNSSTEKPKFPIAPEIAFEILTAANYLDC